MGKALLVMVLVGASFAGGAAVNGAGLRWAQANILNPLGMGEDAPPEVIASNQLAGAGETPIPDEPAASPPSESIAAKPIPPLTLDPPPALMDQEKAREAATAPNTPELEPEPAPAPDPAPDAKVPGLKPAAPRADDRSVQLVSQTEDLSPSGQQVLPEIPNDWAEVRSTLKTLGVSRYGTEGEPGGRVRFYCVIPLAGRRAVGQHFEAEADDELGAARAALKRVVLWRAAQADHPSRKP